MKVISRNQARAGLQLARAWFKKFLKGMSVLFAVVGLLVFTGTASYTNGLQVLLASMAQNESVDILPLINACSRVHLERQVYYICCPPSFWHSTAAQFVFFYFSHCGSSMGTIIFLVIMLAGSGCAMLLECPSRNHYRLLDSLL